VLAEIETNAGNGKLFAFLSQHAEVLHQDYEDNRVRMQCRLDRRYIGKIEQGADTTIVLKDIHGRPLVIEDE